MTIVALCKDRIKLESINDSFVNSVLNLKKIKIYWQL